MAKIRITSGNVEMSATLNETETASKLLSVLPCKGTANRWGDEVYFEIPLEMREENPQAKVPSGAIAYWPPGKAFCIFFGQVPYSPVNVLGSLDGNEKEFSKVRDGDTVTLEKA